MLEKEKLISSLLKVKEQVCCGELLIKPSGIFIYWSKCLKDGSPYALVSDLSWGWEYRTKSVTQPIPDERGVGLWEGKNLEMRLSLIDHILKRLDEVDQDYIDSLFVN